MNYDSTSNAETDRTSSFSRSFVMIATKALVPLGVLALGLAVSAYLLQTAPKATRKPPLRQAHLVEVVPVTFGRETTIVEAMGTVRPARRIELRAQVGGRIVEVGRDFAPGGRFGEGDVILRIDPRDYELLVEQRRAALAEAEASLSIELGNQDIAQREFELLGEAVSEGTSDLVLRKPQLRTARARARSAKALLDEAELNLERTVIRAPFPAVLQERTVELGAHVDTNTMMGTLVDTTEYWIETTIPVTQLRWISIPRGAGEVGASARVYDEAAWGAGVSRNGRVIQLYSDLEGEGRMARVLVAVPDPLLTQEPNGSPSILLLGSYVRVQIDGPVLDKVVGLDRRLLRDGDNVWIMNSDNALEIRPVSVAFRAAESVLIAGGLEPGEKIVVTDLPAAVEAMPLRLADSDHDD